MARFLRDLHRQRRGLRGLSPDDRIGVAVSGGADSLALLLLAHAACPGRVEAATVDHGLRAESAAEAAMVAEVCARLNVPHAVLEGVWNSQAREGLQAAARDYRYRELRSWCGRRRLRLLLTAHHADDQAETLLMRLARGAGVGGLGAIRPARRLSAMRAVNPPGTPHRAEPWPIFLLRPLLRFTKAELAAITAEAGLVAVADPANDSDRFDRTAARRLMASADWLDPARLAASASHLADADEALTWAADREARARIVVDEDEDTASGEDEWLLDPSDLPDEILRRIVCGMLYIIEDYAQVGYTGPDPPGPQVMRLIERLRAGKSATLNHALVKPGPRWRFSIAPPRRDRPKT